MNLTILIPALNEEKTIEIVVEKANHFLAENDIDGEVLVIDNNSTDKTKELAIKSGARVETELKKGYGNAIRKGIEKARGKYVIMGDADDSYNFLEIEDMYKELLNGNDLVVGNRFYNMEKGSMKLLHKYIGTPLLNFLINKKFSTNIKDINCGLRGFDKNRVEELELECDGMELASEMVIKAIKNKLRISQININFYKDARNKKGHLHTIRDGIRHLKLIIKS